MKCKRCGEPLDPMDTHCPVCGRAVGARKKAPKKNENTVVRLPQLDKFTHAYARDTARRDLMQLAVIAAAAVLIVLTVLVYLGVGTLQEAVDQLRLTADAQLQQSKNRPEPTVPTEEETEPETEEPQTEPPTEPVVLPLGQQSLTAALSLYRTNDGTYAAAAMNPPYATAWVNTVREGSSRRTNAAWILPGIGDRLTVNLHDSYGDEDAQAILILNWDAAGSTFGAFSAGVCTWECRVPGGEWEPLSAQWAVTDLAAGTSRLSLTTEILTTLLGQYAMMELRCQVSLSHPDGGSLRIITDGVTINAEGPVTAGSMLD